jgi:hypothetical protein
MREQRRRRIIEKATGEESKADGRTRKEERCVCNVFMNCILIL